jgi:hypothetical protein
VFLHNHAAEVWACDFLQVTDLFFRPLFAFFIIELKSRKVIHVNVTRTPTDPWVAQPLREATPYGQAPTDLIRDYDRKFGQRFAQVAATSGIKVLRAPYRTRAGRMPSVNAHLGKREARMPGSLLHFARETTSPPPEGICCLLQPDSTPSRARAANSRLVGIFSSSPEPGEPETSCSHIRWVTHDYRRTA